MNLLANPQKAFVLENTAKVNKDKKRHREKMFQTQLIMFHVTFLTEVETFLASANLN